MSKLNPIHKTLEDGTRVTYIPARAWTEYAGNVQTHFAAPARKAYEVDGYLVSTESSGVVGYVSKGTTRNGGACWDGQSAHERRADTLVLSAQLREASSRDKAAERVIHWAGVHKARGEFIFRSLCA